MYTSDQIDRINIRIEGLANIKRIMSAIICNHNGNHTSNIKKLEFALQDLLNNVIDFLSEEDLTYTREVFQMLIKDYYLEDIMGNRAYELVNKISEKLKSQQEVEKVVTEVRNKQYMLIHDSRDEDSLATRHDDGRLPNKKHLGND